MSGLSGGRAMLELAERCEAAQGPDRELEWAIFVAVNPDKVTVKRSHRYLYDEQYTRSLDAALSLVPEGLRRLLDEQREYWAVSLWADKFTPVAEGKATTAALALCAAALRARAADTPSVKP